MCSVYLKIDVGTVNLSYDDNDDIVEGTSMYCWAELMTEQARRR